MQLTEGTRAYVVAKSNLIGKREIGRLNNFLSPEIFSACCRADHAVSFVA